MIQTPAAKYWAIFKTQVSNRTAYVSDMLAGSLSILLYVWIFIQLWRATYTAAGQTAIAGWTLRDTLWYLMLTETIVLSKPRLTRLVSEAVKDGSVAYLLNKPYDFLLYQLSVGLGDSLLSMAFNLLAGGALVWLLVGAPPDPRGWPLALVAMLLGWLIDFCFQAIIGLAAFVTEEISAFEWIYQKTLFILGGMLIPLDFFPGWLRTVSEALPFAYTVYGPARLFVEPSLARFWLLALGQVAWLGVMGIIVGLLYRQGMKRLTINGG